MNAETQRTQRKKHREEEKKSKEFNSLRFYLCVSGASVKPVLSRELKGVHLGMTR
jgi:hypothetical protein